VNANLINAGAHHYLFTQYVYGACGAHARSIHIKLLQQGDTISYQLKMHAEAPTFMTTRKFTCHSKTESVA
jgi:hypothetical protein